MLEAWNLQKGLIYTLKWLFINPGKLIRAYIGTERYKITSPFKLLILTTALSFFLIVQFDIQHDFFENFAAGMSDGGSIDRKEAFNNIENVFNNYYNFIIWGGIPLFALGTFLFVRRGFNYMEHLITYIFYLILGNIILIVTLPLIFLDYYGMEAYFILVMLYNFYLYGVALKLNKWYHYLKLLLANLVGYILYIVVIGMVMSFYIAQVSY